ncbi:MAG: GAF domain-containing protein, partial [Crocosphaera sp.]
MTSHHSPPFNLSEAAPFVQLFKKILLGISSHNRDDFFESLILQLTQAFGFEYGFISELKSENSLQVIVEYVKSKPSGYSLYQMEKNPCKKVIKEGAFVCYENLQKEFPEDIWLQENQIESYIGQAIYDQKGKVIGVLCLMSIHALPD